MKTIPNNVYVFIASKSSQRHIYETVSHKLKIELQTKFQIHFKNLSLQIKTKILNG